MDSDVTGGNRESFISRTAFCFNQFLCIQPSDELIPIEVFSRPSMYISKFHRLTGLEYYRYYDTNTSIGSDGGRGTYWFEG